MCPSSVRMLMRSSSAVCPGSRISSGKVLKAKTRKVASRRKALEKQAAALGFNPTAA